MNSQTTNHTSKPKVHRLPQKAGADGRGYVLRIVLMVCVALAIIASIPAFMAMNKKSVRVVESTTAPNAMLSEKTSNGVTVYGSGGEVVGQISELPSNEEPLSQIGTMKKPDSGTGKELLAIIGKY